MKTVLLVEDENAIRDVVAINLKIAGYNVIEAETAEQAIELYDRQENVDIALLDIMLPGKSGYDVCEHIRNSNENTGIIFLTAKTQEENIITGFKGGADDYITKPFSISELIVRLDALYRRVSLTKNTYKLSSTDVLSCGEFKLDLIKHVLYNAESIIELTQIEFQILECFFRNPGKLITRKFILEKVWGDPYYGDEKVVDVNLRRLRVKIESDPSTPDHLITVWGKGYIFQ